MRFRFDQIGKQIGRKALDTSGATFVHDEIAPDAYHADLRHEPDPARAAERARLGLLGRLASVPCLLEIYGHAPGEEEVLACVGKLVAFRQKRARASPPKRGRKKAAAPAKPFLWIIAAGRPSGVLAALGAGPSPDWPKGIYFGPDLFRMGIVVASELPRERSTLLVRLMAAGPLLPQAIEDLAALPRGAHERAVASQILLNLHHALGTKPRQSPAEQEFTMRMYKSWDDIHDEALAQGRKEEAARAVLTVLEARGIAVSDTARARILAQKNLQRLERWLKKAAVATSVTQVMREAS